MGFPEEAMTRFRQERGLLRHQKFVKVPRPVIMCQGEVRQAMAANVQKEEKGDNGTAEIEGQEDKGARQERLSKSWRRFVKLSSQFSKSSSQFVKSMSQFVGSSSQLTNLWMC